MSTTLNPVRCSVRAGAFRAVDGQIFLLNQYDDEKNVHKSWLPNHPFHVVNWNVSTRIHHFDP